MGPTGWEADVAWAVRLGGCGGGLRNVQNQYNYRMVQLVLEPLQRLLDSAPRISSPRGHLTRSP